MAVDWTTVDRNDPAARRRAIEQDMRDQHAKKPVTDANGHARPYAYQPASYQAVITRAQHEATHGPGHHPAEGRDVDRYGIRLGGRDFVGRRPRD